MIRRGALSVPLAPTESQQQPDDRADDDADIRVAPDLSAAGGAGLQLVEAKAPQAADKRAEYGHEYVHE